MTYRELLAVCDLVPATAKRLAMSEPFICENEDLNDFFANDAILYSKHLLGKTYSYKVSVACINLVKDRRADTKCHSRTRGMI